MSLKAKVKLLDKSAVVPRYSHDGGNGDLAADLFSIESKSINPGEVVPIRTGIALEFPEGYGAIVEDRSGLAVKGLTTLAGVVDPGYRGEILVVLTNVSDQAIRIEQGDRIAQLRIVERIKADFEVSDELSGTTREDRGFGSSGR